MRCPSASSTILGPCSLLSCRSYSSIIQIQIQFPIIHHSSQPMTAVDFAMSQIQDFRSEETRQPIFIDSRRVGICDIDKWRHRQVKIGSVAYYGYYSWNQKEKYHRFLNREYSYLLTLINNGQSWFVFLKTHIYKETIELKICWSLCTPSSTMTAQRSIDIFTINDKHVCNLRYIRTAT